MSITKYDSLIQHYLTLHPNLNNSELAHTIISGEYLLPSFKDKLRRYVGTYRKQTGTQLVSVPTTQPFFGVNVGCFHIPFHLKSQWEATVHLIHWLSTVSKSTPVDLNFVGDMMDMNSISRHNKGKKAKIDGLTLSYEYREGNKELDKLEGANLRNKRYMYGNHENWYYAHMSEIDNAKLGEDVVKSPAEGLHLEDRGFVVYNDYLNDKVLVGDLWLTHGSYFNTHAAQKHLEAFNQNVLFFHTHRTQSFTSSGQNGTITAYNGGFGGDRTSQVFNYADQVSKMKWENAITVSYTDELAHTHVEILHWKNDRFIFMGHEFTAKGVKSLF
jgi:hypothetical protein